jgi:hypothetical protein
MHSSSALATQPVEQQRPADTPVLYPPPVLPPDVPTWHPLPPQGLVRSSWAPPARQKLQLTPPYRTHPLCTFPPFPLVIPPTPAAHSHCGGDCTGQRLPYLGGGIVSLEVPKGDNSTLGVWGERLAQAKDYDKLPGEKFCWNCGGVTR